MKIFKSGLELAEANEWKWIFSSSGEYSVKSGYELTRRWKLSRHSDIGEPSNWESSANVWTRFWRSRVPDRVELVTWPLYHDSLPVFSNLSKRGCDTSNGRLFCGFKNENALHLFVNCWWSN